MQHHQTFENLDHCEERPFQKELTECTFINCAFNETDFSQILVVDSTFTDCDLSLANFKKARLQNVRFQNCKLMGVSFSSCNAFGFDVKFDECILDFASFTNLSMKGTPFKKCSLKGADFTGTDLSSALLIDCDLAETVFDQTNLQKADLRGSYHLAIDPTKNRITRAKLSLESLPGLLTEHKLEIS